MTTDLRSRVQVCCSACGKMFTGSPGIPRDRAYRVLEAAGWQIRGPHSDAAWWCPTCPAPPAEQAWPATRDPHRYGPHSLLAAIEDVLIDSWGDTTEDLEEAITGTASRVYAAITERGRVLDEPQARRLARVDALERWLDQADAIADRFPGGYGAGRTAAYTAVRELLAGRR
jgi:hypothetical protein